MEHYEIDTIQYGEFKETVKCLGYEALLDEMEKIYQVRLSTKVIDIRCNGASMCLYIPNATREKKFPPNAHRNARHRKAWRDAARLIITPEKICARCGKHPVKENPLTVHHTTREAYLYENFHLYEKISPELPYELICKRCHYAEHKGMVICKKCKERYHSAGYDTCFQCSGKRENPRFEPGEIHQMYEADQENIAG